MGRGLLFQRQHMQRPAFPERTAILSDVYGISHPFGWLSPSERQIIHVLLTRPPLYSGAEAPFLARLACVKPAANVRSEPGSNSPLDSCLLGPRATLASRGPWVRCIVFPSTADPRGPASDFGSSRTRCDHRSLQTCCLLTLSLRYSVFRDRSPKHRSDAKGCCLYRTGTFEST